MLMVFVVIISTPLHAGLGFDDIPEPVAAIVNAAPVVLPGIVVGFLVQTKLNNPAWHVHAVGLLASMYVTVWASEHYFETQNSQEQVSEYKHGADTACVGACAMYGVGVAAGHVWNALVLQGATLDKFYR